MNGEIGFNPEAGKELEYSEFRVIVKQLTDKCGASELFDNQNLSESDSFDSAAITQFQVDAEEKVYQLKNEHLGRIAYCAIDAFLNLRWGKIEYAKGAFDLEEIESLLSMSLRSGAEPGNVDEIYTLCVKLSDRIERL